MSFACDMAACYSSSLSPGQPAPLGDQRRADRRPRPTSPASTMPEVRRAWDHARALLQELGFDDWAAFEDAKQESLEGHRLRKTPE